MTHTQLPSRAPCKDGPIPRAMRCRQQTEAHHAARSYLTLTRRALDTRLAGAAGVMRLGHGALAQVVAAPALDPDLRDAALRGLALAGYRGDPVRAAAANAAIERLFETDREGAILARSYQRLDVRPAQFRSETVAEAAAAVLVARHTAISACRPLAFGYTDLDGNETARGVLPLALFARLRG